MRVRSSFLVSPAFVLVLACSAGSSSTGSTTGAGAGGEGGTGGTGGASVTSTSSNFATTSQGGGGTICTPGGQDDDVDADGYTPAQGDCEDCDPARNPGAVEVPTEPDTEAFDENCDGQVDEPPPPPCDTGLVIDDMDPVAAARAIGLCKVSSGAPDWGLVSANWVLADGSPPPPAPAANAAFHLGHGMLSSFGPNVSTREGERMLALSSGTARAPGDPGYQSPSGYMKGYPSGAPDGFPKEAPACPGTITGMPFDATGLELVVQAPTNATGFSFDFSFYTFEWPGFVCSTYNDFFIAYLLPFPTGQTDGNISYDGAGNPISVNNALLEVCGCAGNPPSPCSAGGKQFNCSLGNLELIGTGFGFDTAFEDHGATSWLRTTAPVEGGTEIVLRLVTYDSGDSSLDSTTIIDGFRWTAKPGTTVNTSPVPQ